MLMPRLVSDLTPNRRFLENEGFSGVQGLNSSTSSLAKAI
jgi:hypothetical protein